MKPGISVKRNEGGVNSSDVDIYFLVNKEGLGDLYTNGYPSGSWIRIYSSVLEPYKIKLKYFLDHDVMETINPGDSWQIGLPDVYSIDSTSSVKIKFQILYGREPLERVLTIRPR